MTRTFTGSVALAGAAFLAVAHPALAGSAPKASDIFGPFTPAFAMEIATMSLGVGSSGGVSRGIGLSFGDLAASGDVTMSSQSRHAAFRVWTDVSALQGSDDLGRDFDTTNFRVGVDTALSENWTLGIALGHGDIDGTAPAAAGNFTLDGDIRYLQPYLHYERGPWRAGLSLLVGEGDYTVAFAGPPPQTIETELMVWSLGISRDFMIADGAILTASVTHVDGKEDETTVPPRLAAGVTSEFARSSLGARYTRFVGAGGSYYAGLYADFTDSNATFSPPLGAPGVQDWSGRVEFGGSFALSDHSALDIGIEIGGLGGDFETRSANVMWQMRF